jgi:hypothetical protein
MAGTTGLEPAASAVTAPILLVTNLNYATRVATRVAFSAVRNNYWTIIGPGFLTCFLAAVIAAHLTFFSAACSLRWVIAVKAMLP